MEKERYYQKDLEICEKATSGPWEVDEGNDYSDNSKFRHINGWKDFGEDWMCLKKEDAEFISLARTALPWYIRKAVKLEAEIGWLMGALDEIKNATVEFHECGPYEDGKELRRVLGIYDIAEQALSQTGDRWKKMQAVVEAAKEYIKECSGCTYPVGLNCNDHCFYSDIEKALADLEGGAGSE